jgi:hypothetical protein
MSLAAISSRSRRKSKKAWRLANSSLPAPIDRLYSVGSALPLSSRLTMTRGNEILVIDPGVHEIVTIRCVVQETARRRLSASIDETRPSGNGPYFARLEVGGSLLRQSSAVRIVSGAPIIVCRGCAGAFSSRSRGCDKNNVDRMLPAGSIVLKEAPDIPPASIYRAPRVRRCPATLTRVAAVSSMIYRNYGAFKMFD